MTKLPLFVFALALVGCKEKENAKSAPQQRPMSKAAIVLPGESPPVTLPTSAGAGPKVMANRITGWVAIAKDGTVHSWKNGERTSSNVGHLTALSRTLGLPEVPKRAASAFGAAGAAGSAEGANPIDVLFAQLGHPEPASGVPAPATRATSAFAIAHPHDVSAGVLVVADSAAPATALVDVLALTGGFIAVQGGDELGALPYAFDRQPPPFVAPQTPWTEVRVGSAMEVETVPGKAIGVAVRDKLGETVSATKATAVDLLVAPDTKVADVVAAIEQLRAAKVEAIGLGRIPAADSPAMAARGEKGPRVLAWDFYLQDAAKGDAAGARTAFDAALEPMLGCYKKALDAADSAQVTGTARVELVVQADGKVKDLQAIGVPPQLATCATSALKPVVFPKAAAAGKLVAQVAFVPR